MKIKRAQVHRAILAFILILAAGIRGYDLFSIPFTNDELSALARTRFDSFSDLIREGVMPDGHPPLVQVWLYFLVKAFGETAWLIKLPFLICGLLAIYFAYRIAAYANNRQLGLLVAAWMATLQYFVAADQVARPYAPGLLFVLLFTFTGLQITLSNQRSFWVYARMAVFLVLAGSTHYLATLVTFLCGIYFLLTEKRSERKKLLFVALAGVFLFLPQLPVFLDQVVRGGVGGENGWLGKPTLTFLRHFFSYFNQFHVAGYVVFVSGLLTTAYFMFKAPANEMRLLLLCIGAFMLFLLVTWLYSAYRNPVLQLSSFYFVSPFLLIVTGYGFSKLKNSLFYTSLVTVAAVGLYGLVIKRQHYSLFYQQGYAASAESIRPYVHASTLLIGNSEVYYRHYLPDQSRVNQQFVAADIPPQAFFALLSEPSLTDTLVLTAAVAVNPLYFSLASRLFPNLIAEEKGAGYETVIRCRAASGTNGSTQFAHFTPSSKYAGSAFQTTASALSFQPSPDDILDISCTYKSIKPGSNPLLVFSIKAGEKEIFWSAGEPFRVGNDSAFALLSVRLTDIPLSEATQLTAYVWNRDRSDFDADKPVIRCRKGNPLLYGLVNKINEN